MVVKVFDAYIEGEKKATGTIDELADYFDLSRNSISLWIKNGKDPKKANHKYKHAILNKEKTKELIEQKKKEERKLPASVYDYYNKGEFIMTGTAREISQFLNISKNNVYSYIQVGKHAFDYRKTRKHAILNEAETRKRFPLFSISSEEEFIETEKEQERRKHETKEERRLRRNIRAQMAIENLRKEELGL
ncbi:hypothetical protein DS50902_16 [Lactococcus phage 50902]|uniref:Uncharacterized protein n=1 Tax=Lactococcus phage 50902 TaxID=1868848 RepID=A0A1P8BKP4_9CAUD|nr:DUF658 family protein [Lactococcus phage 50902]ANT43406.1 hypothetical protein DS50902_16 [Lactococcus phage 50902]